MLNIELLESNVSHNIIFLSNKNYKEIFRKIKSLKKNFNKFSSKAFFFYFFKDPSLNVKNQNICLKKMGVLSNLSSNIFIEDFFNHKGKFFDSRNLLYLKFPFDVSAINLLLISLMKKLSD